MARKRFEDREARLLRIKQERAEKMARRKQVLKDKTAQQECIKASIQRAENKSRSKPEGQSNGARDDT